MDRGVLFDCFFTEIWNFRVQTNSFVRLEMFLTLLLYKYKYSKARSQDFFLRGASSF